MSQNTIIVGAAAAVAAGTCWYLFRPELLFVNKSVHETLPTVQAGSARQSDVLLATGKFRGIAHATRGTAEVHMLGGQRVLRLTGFETSNGPDVHVYLVAASDAKDNDTVKKSGFIDLGSIKGNVGDQNYALTSDVDLTRYQAVTIWCARFGVNFGTAPLGTLTARTGTKKNEGHS